MKKQECFLEKEEHLKGTQLFQKIIYTFPELIKERLIFLITLFVINPHVNMILIKTDSM